MTPPPLIKKRYGRLSVIRLAGIDQEKRWLWICQCSCGKRLKILGAILRTDLVTSCGCAEEEIEKLQEENMRLTQLLQEERSGLLFRLLKLMRR